jgi:large subunit ribosomal protein L9
MEVILLEKIENLGNLGDKVGVRSGFARNYLVPQGKAKYATPENIAEFEAQRSELEQAAAQSLSQAEIRRLELEGLEVTITAKAGNEGKLFGSVGTADIAQAVNETGVALEKRELRVSTGPLRVLGEYEIEVHLHSDVNTTIKVIIVPEE